MIKNGKIVLIIEQNTGSVGTEVGKSENKMTEGQKNVDRCRFKRYSVDAVTKETADLFANSGAKRRCGQPVAG